jgi:predicted house-cleaning noncanonical NTP pyrophosphatase (MazG superfamily)
MKVPIIKHLFLNNEAEKLENTLEVLESLSEARGITDEEMNIIGEFITNICGALGSASADCSRNASH